MTVPEGGGEETTTTTAAAKDAKDALENLSLRPETASNNNAGWQTQGEKEKGGKPKPPGKEESTHKWKEEDDVF